MLNAYDMLSFCLVLALPFLAGCHPCLLSSDLSPSDHPTVAAFRFALLNSPCGAPPSTVVPGWPSHQPDCCDRESTCVNLSLFSRLIRMNIAYSYPFPGGGLAVPPFNTLLCLIGVHTLVHVTNHDFVPPVWKTGMLPITPCVRIGLSR